VWPRAWLTWTDGRAAGTGGRRLAQTGCGPEQTARAAAGKPKSRCHAMGVAYEDGRTGRRVQAIPPQSGVTACNSNETGGCVWCHQDSTYDITLWRHEIRKIPDHFTSEKRVTKLVKHDVIMLQKISLEVFSERNWRQLHVNTHMHTHSRQMSHSSISSLQNTSFFFLCYHLWWIEIYSVMNTSKL